MTRPMRPQALRTLGTGEAALLQDFLSRQVFVSVNGHSQAPTVIVAGTAATEPCRDAAFNDRSK
jgi:hypothetical protein